MNMETTQDLNDLFTGYYDTLAIFFGGDAVMKVLLKRFNVNLYGMGLQGKDADIVKAVKWMEKKSKEINRCVPGTTGYWVEPKCR